MPKLDFASAGTGRKRKLDYLGHRPLGTKKSGLDKKEQQRRKGLVKDYKENAKVSSTIIPDEVFSKDDKLRERRLKRVRQRMLKQAKFSLGDSDEEEEVTIGGRTIDSLGDDFDDQDLAGLESSDDEMGAEQTASHFGGGGDEPAAKKSRKDIYKEVIAKSKRAKADDARNKVEQSVLLRDLDSKLDQLKSELEFRPARDTEAGHKLELEEKKLDILLDKRHPREKEEEDQFDQLLRQMKTAPTSVAGARSKTAAELALEKAKKLEAIEKERLRNLKQFQAAQKNTSDDEDTSGDTSDDDSESDDSESDASDSSDAANPWTNELSESD